MFDSIERTHAGKNDKAYCSPCMKEGNELPFNPRWEQQRLTPTKRGGFVVWNNEQRDLIWEKWWFYFWMPFFLIFHLQERNPRNIVRVWVGKLCTRSIRKTKVGHRINEPNFVKEHAFYAVAQSILSLQCHVYMLSSCLPHKNDRQNPGTPWRKFRNEGKTPVETPRYPQNLRRLFLLHVYSARGKLEYTLGGGPFSENFYLCCNSLYSWLIFANTRKSQVA